MFEVLAEIEKEPAINATLVEIETGQGTKHWVEKTFGEKESTLGKNGTYNKKSNTKMIVEQKQSLTPADSQTVEKGERQESEADARSSNKAIEVMGNNHITQTNEEKGESSYKFGKEEDIRTKSYPDLQEITEEEK
uniref:Uncharacterized protein n=1 Tax=Solanum tuberosum TaxID=4113 RepID=M1DY78_SOLTU